MVLLAVRNSMPVSFGKKSGAFDLPFAGDTVKRNTSVYGIFGEEGDKGYIGLAVLTGILMGVLL